MSVKKHAIIIGANGLVGNELTKQLIRDNDYDKVTLVTRRWVDIEDEKLEVKIVDFKDIHKDWEVFTCDDIYYCLGTTKSNTPNAKEYYKIEYEYCINIAKISHHNKVKKFLYLSSMGAGSKSWFQYLKLKGMTEEQLMQIGFDYLHIFRPYVLMGKRSDFRFGESIAKIFLKIFDFMMIGFLKNIKGMPAPHLAKAMIHSSKLKSKGVFIHSNRNIHEFFPKV